MTTNYSTQKIEQTENGPTQDFPNGFVEYSVRFTDVSDASNTFDAHIQTDGSDLDFQNACRKLLALKFPAAPKDISNPSHTFQVNNGSVNIVA